jgi:hypothetical protein
MNAADFNDPEVLQLVLQRQGPYYIKVPQNLHSVFNTNLSLVFTNRTDKDIYHCFGK